MIDIVADGLDHPECVIVGDDQTIFAGGEGGQLYQIDAVTGDWVIKGSTGGWLLGLAIDGSGRVVGCDPKLRALVSFDEAGNVAVVSRGTTDRAMVNPNYPAFASDGMLYVSDSGVWPEGGGCIFRVAPNGATEVWSTGTPQFTNGLALHPSGEALYVVESTLPGITRIPILDDGSAGDPELVALLPGTVPDGIAFDERGSLYVGCYRPDRIYRIDEDGTVVIVLDDYRGTDLSAPTNIAFGGADRRDLFIASLGRWHIARIRVPYPGAELSRPRPITGEAR